VQQVAALVQQGRFTDALDKVGAVAKGKAPATVKSSTAVKPL
jgi:hypothetical protein